VHTTRRRHGQKGFTLIELLVVIVILGILSAVVVFAVRGTGDKGKQNAVATDARIVRTALETYCAKNGHYPADPDGAGPKDPMDVLVADKYLSSRSTYTPLTTGDGLAAFPEGNCGAGGVNGPSHYQIENVNPTIPTTTTTQAPPVCPYDTFCDVPTHPGGAPAQGPGAGQFEGTMVSLPTGKVLAFISVEGVSEYDPSVGSFGSWSSVAPNPLQPGVGQTSRDYLSGTAAVIGSRSSSDDCGGNCGRVLAYLGYGGWNVYDPMAKTWAPAGTSLMDPGPNSGGTIGETAGQILGSNCGDYCGQFLMVYQTCRKPCTGGTPAELWDPKTGNFTIVSRSIFGTNAGQAASIVALPDSRVLVTAFGQGSSPKYAKLFIPTSFKSPDSVIDGLAFQGLDPHTVEHFPWHDHELLANGDVLFIDWRNGAAEVFNHLTSTWESRPSCVATADPGCRGLTAFADGGKVLAVVKDLNSGRVTTAWRFDPSASTPWSQTAGNPSNATAWASVIGGPEGTKHRGQVLTVAVTPLNFNSAVVGSQLYIPPA